MIAGRPLVRWPSIQAATASSQGRRSASVSPMPACIFAILASGWSQSPSSKGQPSRGKLLRHGALARTRYAHDDQDRRGAAMGAWTLQPMDASRIRDKHRSGPANEQAALDDPDHPSDPLFEASRISDGAESAVENSIAAVGDKRLPGRRHAHTCLGSERLNPRLCCLQAKGHDLDRYRRSRSETVAQLGFVDDDRE